MSQRRVALEVMMDVAERGAYANLALKQWLSGQDERDAAFISALVYTTLEHISYLDYWIDHYAKGRLQAVLRNILRLSLSQVLYMQVPDRAACDEAVKLAKEVGKGALSGYVNGVMRAMCREKETPPALPQEPEKKYAILSGFPEFMIKEYLSLYGEAFTAELVMSRGMGGTLRAQFPYSAADLSSALQLEKIPYEACSLLPEAIRVTGLDVSRHPLFTAGKITIQSESAMLVCRALGAEPGDKILDACAAPGGKTAYLASLLQNNCDITAWELHPHRVELMKKTFQRLAVAAKTVEMDASLSHPEHHNAYDAVLIDAPCSGFGVFGKPDVRLARDEESVQGLAVLQQRILNACCAYVRPGGTLLYATCTISHRENEAQIQRFLQQHEEFALQSLRPFLTESLSERGKSGMLQLFPNLDGAEGFFMARMTRK